MKTRFQSIGFHYGNGFDKRYSRLTHEGVTSLLYNIQRKSLKLSEATDVMFEAVEIPVKNVLQSSIDNAITFKVAYHFYNENQMIKTEFARRAVGTHDDSFPLYHWSF